LSDNPADGLSGERCKMEDILAAGRKYMKTSRFRLLARAPRQRG
jgi:hypothetical protein